MVRFKLFYLLFFLSITISTASFLSHYRNQSEFRLFARTISDANNAAFYDAKDAKAWRLWIVPFSPKPAGLENYFGILNNIWGFAVDTNIKFKNYMPGKNVILHYEKNEFDQYQSAYTQFYNNPANHEGGKNLDTPLILDDYCTQILSNGRWHSSLSPTMIFVACSPLPEYTDTVFYANQHPSLQALFRNEKSMQQSGQQPYPPFSIRNLIADSIDKIIEKLESEKCGNKGAQPASFTKALKVQLCDAAVSAPLDAKRATPIRKNAKTETVMGCSPNDIFKTVIDGVKAQNIAGDQLKNFLLKGNNPMLYFSPSKNKDQEAAEWCHLIANEFSGIDTAAAQTQSALSSNPSVRGVIADNQGKSQGNKEVNINSLQCSAQANIQQNLALCLYKANSVMTYWEEYIASLTVRAKKQNAAKQIVSQPLPLLIQVSAKPFKRTQSNKNKFSPLMLLHSVEYKVVNAGSQAFADYSLPLPYVVFDLWSFATPTSFEAGFSKLIGQNRKLASMLHEVNTQRTSIQKLGLYVEQLQEFIDIIDDHLDGKPKVLELKAKFMASGVPDFIENAADIFLTFDIQNYAMSQETKDEKFQDEMEVNDREIAKQKRKLEIFKSSASKVMSQLQPTSGAVEVKVAMEDIVDAGNAMTATQELNHDVNGFPLAAVQTDVSQSKKKGKCLKYLKAPVEG